MKKIIYIYSIQSKKYTPLYFYASVILGFLYQKGIKYLHFHGLMDRQDERSGVRVD